MTNDGMRPASRSRAGHDDIARAVTALRAGGAVAFPTDTVYGVGVSVEHASSPQIIFDIKQRDAGKPVAWLVGGVEDLAHYGKDVPARAFELARKHWPGALTLVVNANDAVPPAFRSREGTIGLRAPANAVALSLIEALGCPIATSSANLSGEPAPRVADELDPRFLSCVAALVRDDGLVRPDEPPSGEPASGEPASGVPSTVLDCTGPDLVVLRAGAIAVQGS